MMLCCTTLLSATQCITLDSTNEPVIDPNKGSIAVSKQQSQKKQLCSIPSKLEFLTQLSMTTNSMGSMVHKASCISIQQGQKLYPLPENSSNLTPGNTPSKWNIYKLPRSTNGSNPPLAFMNPDKNLQREVKDTETNSSMSKRQHSFLTSL